jgi:hypothetical protein
MSLPERGFTRRMWVYMVEMYPPLPRLAQAVLVVLSFHFLLSRIFKTRFDALSLSTVTAVLSVFTFLLILRLMDELKDRDVDKELFAHRPLPSGRTREQDIRFSLIMAVLLFLGFNTGDETAFKAACLVLGYSFLMFHNFFFPRLLRRHLLLTLATHNPVIPVLLIYLAVRFFQDGGAVTFKTVIFGALPVILMYWCMFFAWEIARKIRSREEENDYVTYSWLLGPAGAVALATGAQTATLLIGIHLIDRLSLPMSSALILSAGYFMVMAGYVRFLVRPGPGTSKLRPFAELYIMVVMAAVGMGIFQVL